MPLSEAAKYVKPLANNILALELKDLELIHQADGRQVCEISLTIVNISGLLNAYTENISKNLDGSYCPVLPANSRVYSCRHALEAPSRTISSPLP